MSFFIQGRFGPEQVVYCKDKKNPGFPVGYFEISGKVFRLDINPSPQTKRDGVTAIVKIRPYERNRNQGRGGPRF
jgi:hypothetical protein